MVNPPLSTWFSIVNASNRIWIGIKISPLLTTKNYSCDASNPEFYPNLSLKPVSHRPEPMARYASIYSQTSATSTMRFPDSTTIPNIILHQVAIDSNISEDLVNRKENPILSHRDFQSAMDRTMHKGILYEDKWSLKKDLLDSNEFDKSFVTEIDTDGTVSLRFGDDIFFNTLIT